jgi:hypothetical protein
MKKSMKICVAVLSALMALSVMAACGNGGGDNPAAKQAKLSGSYNSESHIDFFTAYPGYTYRQATFTVQNLETYDDGTYILTVVAPTFSGGLTFDPLGTGDTHYSATDRGNLAAKYYGTFTSSDEGGLLLTVLAKPTRVTYNYRGTSTTAYFADTANWTEAMGIAVVAEGATPATASEYLAKMAFAEVTLLIDPVLLNFEYANLAVA